MNKLPIDLIIKVGGTLLAIGIAWGSLNSRLAAQEVKTQGVPELLSKISTRLDSIAEEQKDIKTDIRLMRRFQLRNAPPGSDPPF